MLLMVRAESVSVPDVATLNAVGIVAADMAASVRFYQLLGLDVPDPSPDHLETSLPNGVRLMFDTESVVASFDEGWKRVNGNQLSLAFECDSPAEVDDVYARVVAAGFHGRREPWDAFWGQRYAQLSDPDGVPVDLYAAL
jgi:catechol 2,3-dioxygenase-like lactoylglutathione lyase family enzyme